MSRFVRVALLTLFFTSLGCLAAPSISEAETTSLLRFSGPVGIHPRSMPLFAAVHPLVVASLQAIISVMALLAFPARHLVTAESK